MSEFFNKTDEAWDTYDENGDGKPGITHFSNAVQVWAIMQMEKPENKAKPLGTEVSVADAAAAFCCDPRMIIEAVEHHYWMFLGGADDDYTKMYIEHEGE